MWKDPRYRASSRSGAAACGAGGAAGGVPAPRPSRVPSRQAGGGKGPKPGAWRRSPRASLLRCPGLLPAPVREARRLCPGMAGDAGWEGRGFPTGRSLAWGLGGMRSQEPVGEPGASRELHSQPSARNRRRGPAGSTRVDPELRAAVGSRVAVVCTPQSQHTNAMRAHKPASPSPGGVGARGARGREGGRGGCKDAARPRCGRGAGRAPQGFGPAAAGRGGVRAARCPPSALRSLPAGTSPRNERRKSVHLKGRGRPHPDGSEGGAAGTCESQGNARCHNAGAPELSGPAPGPSPRERAPSAGETVPTAPLPSVLSPEFTPSPQSPSKVLVQPSKRSVPAAAF